MKKALKAAGKLLLLLLILIAVLLLGVFIWNRVMLSREKPLLEDPPGQMISIDGMDGKKMCVYTEGSGDSTVVFLSGSGTASPIYNFKPLYSRLSSECRIVVIEKYGYGFSDISGGDRSFDTMLEQDREALAKAGIEAPYILCPHSMSGLEAVLWAQEYPDEVEAVTGLDMWLPASYDGYDFPAVLRKEKLAAAARTAGLIRFFYPDGAFPDDLTEEEKAVSRAIACRKAVNADIISETEAIPAVCEKIRSRPQPDIPTLIFASAQDSRNSAVLKEYAAGLTDGAVTELDCGHEVHNFEYERISSEMKEFIRKLDK